MKRGGSVSGAVSLVMIFCVLCLAIFAVLTYATAQREQKLSNVNAQLARDYYEADTKAVQIVSDLKAGKEPTADFSEEETEFGTTYSFSIPAGGEQTLSVQVAIDGGECTILRWQTVYVGEWEPDYSLDVWDGEDLF